MLKRITKGTREMNKPMTRKQWLAWLKKVCRKAQSTCNGFCGEYECKENQAICKRKAEK